jgi:formate C-acetyltransferase
MAEPAHKLDIQGRSNRFSKIRADLLANPLHLCPERAILMTESFKRQDDPSEPMVIRKARALNSLLRNKSVIIYPDELIVGNVGSKRRSVMMHPEMAGVFLCQDILWMERRKTAPLRISWPEKLKIAAEVIPYWLGKNMIMKSFSGRFSELSRYIGEQLRAQNYFINESNGIGHLIPNYEKMLQLGVTGYLASFENEEKDLHKAMRIACEGVIEFANRLAAGAEDLARTETDPERKEELLEIARICGKVPLRPAQTFHEALQSVWLTHLAVNLEGLNSAVSFGRMDQYLLPYYEKDLQEGRLDRDHARELLLSFCAKADEHFYLLSKRTSEYHGGLLVVQAITIGGVDREGKDAVNDLTYLFLDVMEESGLKEPNFLARIGPDSPEAYVSRVLEVARQGKGMPAIFGDKASIGALRLHGFSLEDSRDYGVVGCVELSLPGKSFFSTDAGLMNLAVCLELALNSGRKLKGGKRIGKPTARPESFSSIEDLFEAFRIQMEHMLDGMIRDLKNMEAANRDYHPTPFTSMLVDGCVESGLDVTAGGAQYNSSGIQGVGVADVADSLAALETVVFRERKYTMTQVIEAMKNDFATDTELRARLLKAPKYGNDIPFVDEFAGRVVRAFHGAMTQHRNTRNGGYVPGFYSTTCHIAFGKGVCALPSGRKAGKPLASSLGPSNGSDKQGPTALLNSVSSVDSRLSPNGYALNLRFDPSMVSGTRGLTILSALTRGYIDKGGMELQLNVVDPELLEDARANPGKHPDLIVRVAGYCAYFDHLPDSAKQEIIDRTRIRI